MSLASQQAAHLLAMAERIAQAGSWTMDLKSPQWVSCSLEFSGIIGLLPALAITRDELIARFSPDSRDRIGWLFQQCSRHGTGFDEEMQIDTPSSRKWVRIVCEGVHNKRGQVKSLQGMLRDISDLKQAQQETLHLAMRLTTTLSTITDAFVSGTDSVNVTANELLILTTGTAAGQGAGTSSNHLETLVTKLAASVAGTGTGGLYLTEGDDLVMGSLSAINVNRVGTDESRQEIDPEVHGEHRRGCAVSLSDRGNDDGIDEGGDRPAVHHSGGLVQLRTMREAHPGVVGSHVFELQPDEAREEIDLRIVEERLPVISAPIGEFGKPGGIGGRVGVLSIVQPRCSRKRSSVRSHATVAASSL